MTLPATTRDVGKLLSDMHTQDKAENQQCFEILSNLRFPTRQGCAIQGNGDETGGNFLFCVACESLRNEGFAPTCHTLLWDTIFVLQRKAK